MWTLSKIICLMILILLSVKDIQVHKVPSSVLFVAGTACLVYQLIIGKMHIVLILGGMGIGLLFLIISKVTREGIGYGDSYGILILGSFLGLWDILMVVAIAFFLLLCVTIPMLCLKKMSRTCALAFYPFLTLGYIGVLLLGGVQG